MSNSGLNEGFKKEKALSSLKAATRTFKDIMRNGFKNLY